MNKVLMKQPLFFIVGGWECKRSVWNDASTRSNVGTNEKWFDDFAPSVTILFWPEVLNHW
jgi:hypothetical protein